jgi:hypothetical protein
MDLGNQYPNKPLSAWVPGHRLQRTLARFGLIWPQVKPQHFGRLAESHGHPGRGPLLGNRHWRGSLQI